MVTIGMPSCHYDTQVFNVHNVKPYDTPCDTPCDSHAAFDADGQENSTSSLCHQIMLVLDASVDTLRSCLGAGAKLELHRNHCSLVLPVQQCVPVAMQPRGS